MSIKKRTFGFDEYQKKISEGLDEIGFKKYIQEHEDETTASVDDLGEGEKLDTDTTSDTPSTEEETPETETPATEPKSDDDSLTPIDTGNREDIGDKTIATFLQFSENYIKSLKELINKTQSEGGKIDKATKDRVIKFYNTIQGI
jgi:hypothetical protein